MTRKSLTYLTVVIVLFAMGIFAWNLTARAAYESAEYTVLESDGSFEIREYPDLILASTEMQAGSEGGDGSFMRLFRYISGANEDDQKVSMTTPVFMEEPHQDSKGRMGFVIPKKVALEGVPKPVAADVQVRKREGGRFAVIRFSGRVNAKSSKIAEEKLREWALSKGLSFHEESEYAGYDPPWTPGPLRRNEVLIRLSE
jgi:DNA gyrase inhibitor GyrI